MKQILIKTTLASLVLNFLIILIFYSKLPAQIAVHFDNAGNPNGYLRPSIYLLVIPFLAGLVNIAAVYRLKRLFAFTNTYFYYIAPLITLGLHAAILYKTIK